MHISPSPKAFRREQSHHAGDKGLTRTPDVTYTYEFPHDY
jgi:hypothetical protein